MSTHYEILGIPHNATFDDIKTAHRAVVFNNHPDRTFHLPEPERQSRELHCKAANTACEVLSDPHKRREYDARHGFNTGKSYGRARESAAGSGTRGFEAFQYRNGELDPTVRLPPTSLLNLAHNRRIPLAPGKRIALWHDPIDHYRRRVREAITDEWFHPSVPDCLHHFACWTQSGWDLDVFLREDAFAWGDTAAGWKAIEVNNQVKSIAFRIGVKRMKMLEGEEKEHSTGIHNALLCVRKTPGQLGVKCSRAKLRLVDGSFCLAFFVRCEADVPLVGDEGREIRVLLE